MVTFEQLLPKLMADECILNCMINSNGSHLFGAATFQKIQLKTNIKTYGSFVTFGTILGKIATLCAFAIKIIANYLISCNHMVSKTLTAIQESFQRCMKIWSSLFSQAFFSVFRKLKIFKNITLFHDFLHKLDTVCYC
jgi:hypothetical protein